MDEAEADLSDGVLVGVAMKLLGLVAIGETQRPLRGVGDFFLNLNFVHMKMKAVGRERGFFILIFNYI